MNQLQIISKMEGLKNKSWMHNGKTFQVFDVVEIGDTYLLATDGKAIKVKKEQADKFVGELLPVDETPQRGVQPVIDNAIVSQLTQGLLAQFTEIRKATSDEHIKRAGAKAKHMVSISNGINNLAKTSIAARKLKEE